jgi:hypothetical protein
MRTIVAIIALAFIASVPASAESAKSFAPGQHAKVHGQHGASYYAPGHVKKRPSLHMQSASGVSPGHKKKY